MPSGSQVDASSAEDGSQPKAKMSRHMAVLSEMSSLFQNSNITIALPIFFVGTFRGISLRLLLHYTSVRFNWKLAEVCQSVPTVAGSLLLIESQTNGLITEVAGVNLVLCLFAMPWILVYLKEHLHLQTQVVNLTVVRGSLLILACGSVLVALAPNSFLLILGKLRSPALGPHPLLPFAFLSFQRANIKYPPISCDGLRVWFRCSRYYAIPRNILGSIIASSPSIQPGSPSGAYRNVDWRAIPAKRTGVGIYTAQNLVWSTIPVQWCK